MTRRIDLPDEAATLALGRQLADALPDSLAGWTILLEGPLGAGKSTFARGLLRALGHSSAVPSPTYTLVEPYDLARGQLYHVDLYRVASVDELHYLGWDELDDGCRVVEWADRAPGLVESADLVFALDYAGDGRRAELRGLSGRGRALVAGWGGSAA